MLQFVLLSLAVWRLTALLVYDDGPGDVFVRLRDFSDAHGGPLHCFWCTSFWVGFVASFVVCNGSWYLLDIPWWLWCWGVAGMAALIDEFRPGGCNE